jgi:polysaccharide chain length determinant protein (PEP-CTERM system associated)
MLPGRQYTPEELLRLLWFRRWIVIVFAIFTTLGAVALSMQIKNVYRSETLILLVPQRVAEAYVKTTMTVRIEDRLRSLQEEILSRTRLEKVINDFNLYPELRAQQPMEEVVAIMKTNIDVDTVRDDAFKVSFTSGSPRTAMIVADRLAGMFIDENVRAREGFAKSTDDFLESQLEDARRRLEEHENKLKLFRERYSGELPQQLESNLTMLRSTQQQIQSLNESIDRDRDHRLALEKSISDALNGAVDVPGAEAKAETTLDLLDKAKGELRALELRLKPGHPDLTAKQKLVASLEKQVQAEAAAGLGASSTEKPPSPDVVRQARARQYQQELDKVDKQIAQKQLDVDRLKSVVADYQRRVESVPGHESEMTSLMRDYETLQKVYANLLAKKEDSKISANLERQQVGEQFKILDPARLPERPFSPNRIRITLIGFGVGLALGLALAGFLEYRDTSLRTEDEIVKMLVLPVVAAIPVMTSIGERRRHRRNLVLTGLASMMLVAGALVAMLWRMALLPGLR